ncbi:hypothetical protein NPIL_163221, partial [Nephila pilipes]
VIDEKKRRYLKAGKDCDETKRKAMLDLLLEHHFDSDMLSEEDIKEEVLTFIMALRIAVIEFVEITFRSVYFCLLKYFCLIRHWVDLDILMVLSYE